MILLEVHVVSHESSYQSCIEGFGLPCGGKQIKYCHLRALPSKAVIQITPVVRPVSGVFSSYRAGRYCLLPSALVANLGQRGRVPYVAMS